MNAMLAHAMKDTTGAISFLLIETGDIKLVVDDLARIHSVLHSTAGARFTWVEEEQCTTDECRLDVSTTGNIQNRPKGENIYLDYQVDDIGENGLSHVLEVKQMIEEIIEDHEKGVIERKTLYRRLAFLIFLISKAKIGEFSAYEGKEKALALVNVALVQNGYKPQQLRRVNLAGPWD